MALGATASENNLKKGPFYISDTVGQPLRMLSAAKSTLFDLKSLQCKKNRQIQANKISVLFATVNNIKAKCAGT